MPASKNTIRAAKVDFPETELWNDRRKLVQFPAVANNKPIACAITYDALAARYGASGNPDKYLALDVFKANRPSIESLVQSFLQKSRVKSDKELVIGSDGTAWQLAKVHFPQLPKEKWDSHRDLVSFPACAGEKQIMCFISYEALWTRYGARGAPSASTALGVFCANRASIQTLASLLIEEGRMNDDNVLMIKSGDVLREFAGTWKNDPTADEMLREIYHRRGRPMTENGR